MFWVVSEVVGWQLNSKRNLKSFVRLEIQFQIHFHTAFANGQAATDGRHSNYDFLRQSISYLKI